MTTTRNTKSMSMALMVMCLVTLAPGLRPTAADNPTRTAKLVGEAEKQLDQALASAKAALEAQTNKSAGGEAKLDLPRLIEHIEAARKKLVDAQATPAEQGAAEQPVVAPEPGAQGKEKPNQESGKAGDWGANKPTDKDVILPCKAVRALLATPWVIKYYHGANPIRLQSRHVPVDAKLEVNKTPVVVDEVLRKPRERFARFEITAVEEVSLLKGYAVSFRYPSEGVVGTVLLVPAMDDWRVVSVSGGEI